mmetsp:Transcript_1767/g.2593  ORF Transcript_1767/g.2593 Transcript_1767/m.2593 type:complete len:361 (-) Transcript_1767:93-1175(-)
MMSSNNTIDPYSDVDVCAAIIHNKPPKLPLREELLSLGAETIYKPRGTITRIAEQKVKKKKILDDDDDDKNGIEEDNNDDTPKDEEPESLESLSYEEVTDMAILKDDQSGRYVSNDDATIEMYRMRTFHSPQQLSSVHENEPALTTAVEQQQPEEGGEDEEYTKEEPEVHDWGSEFEKALNGARTKLDEERQERELQPQKPPDKWELELKEASSHGNVWAKSRDPKLEQARMEVELRKVKRLSVGYVGTKDKNGHLEQQNDDWQVQLDHAMELRKRTSLSYSLYDIARSKRTDLDWTKELSEANSNVIKRRMLLAQVVDSRQDSVNEFRRDRYDKIKQEGQERVDWDSEIKCAKELTSKS